MSGDAAVSKDLAPGDKVEVESEIKLTVTAENLPEGAKARFKFVLVPKDHDGDDPIEVGYKDKSSNITEQKFKEDVPLTADGDKKAFVKKFFISSDPEFGIKDKQTKLEGHAAPSTLSDPMKMTGGDIFTYADEKFKFCANVLVEKHRLFYWWSDHNHYHAKDTAEKMEKWLKYFVEPHYPNGIFPKDEKKSPAFKSYAQLAKWGGFLHDLGMGANPRMQLELDEIDKLPADEALKFANDKTCKNEAHLSGWLAMVQELLKYLEAVKDKKEEVKISVGGDFTLPVPKNVEVADLDRIKKAAFGAFAKLHLEWHGDGVRSRHSLNSTLYCLDPSSKNKLRQYFTEHQLQKLALMVCMHSKSKYGKLGIDEDAYKKGYADILANSTNLLGTDPNLAAPGKWTPIFKAPDAAKPPPAPKSMAEIEPPKEGDAWRPWGPWLKEQSYKATVEATGKKVEGSPMEVPPIKVDERRYISVLTRAIGVVDNMRVRGNTGEFRDNRGVSFRTLPLDVWEAKVLNEEPGPIRVHTGSFRLAKKSDRPGASCTPTAEINGGGALPGELVSKIEGAKTFLEVVRAVNKLHPKLKGLFGDLKDDDANARFAEVVNPGLLNILTWHPDNEVLVPMVSWPFNIGELNIAYSELTSVGELKGPKPTGPGITDETIVDRVVIDTDCDPTATAHIVADIVGEGPRAFEANWVVLIEKSKEGTEGGLKIQRTSKTFVDQWFMQDFVSNSYEVRPKYEGKLDDRPKRSIGFDQFEGFYKGYAPIKYKTFDNLMAFLKKCSEEYGAQTFIETKDGLKNLGQAFS